MGTLDTGSTWNEIAVSQVNDGIVAAQPQDEREQMEINKEREMYNLLIKVLEDTLEKAAGVLGQDTRDSSRKRRVTIHHASEIYEFAR